MVMTTLTFFLGFANQEKTAPVAQAGVSRLHTGMLQEVQAYERQGPMKKLGPRVTGMISDVLDLP